MINMNTPTLISICIFCIILSFIIGFILIMFLQLKKINFKKQYGYNEVGKKIKVKSDIKDNYNYTKNAIDGEKALQSFRKG